MTSFVEKALLVPLGTAAVGMVAELLRERLSKGRTEANLCRLEAIQTILADDSLGLPEPDKNALRDEARIIAESLLVLRRRQIALARTANTVLHWENQPFARRLLTLPQPRSSSGWLATGLCLLFLYLAWVVVLALNSVIRIWIGQDLSAFLLLIAFTILLPLFLALASRAKSLRLAEARIPRQRWTSRPQLLRLVTLPRPRSRLELLSACIWLVSSAWLLWWGAFLTIGLLQGQWQRLWHLEVVITGETLLLLPGAILIFVFSASAVYMRNSAIDAAKHAIHRSSHHIASA
ncbi:MAG: hypothetical protein AB1Z22_09355 [Synechococcaceae cyanobacterium]